MSFDIVRPSLFEATVKGVIPANEVEVRVVKTLKKLSREVNLRGFRKGKVPTSVIEKRFWDEIRPDLESEFVNETYEAANAQEALVILMEPSLDIKPIVRGEDFTFELKLYVRPKIDVQGLDALIHKPEPIVVTDEDVEKAVSETREQFASRDAVEQPAGPGLFATIDATLKKDDGTDYLGPIEAYTVELGQNSIAAGFDEQLEGMSAGDEKEFTLSLEHGDHKHDIVCKAKVSAVLRKTLPEVDATFLEKLGFENEDDWRADARTKLVEEAESMARNATREKLMEQLVEGNPMEVPEILIEKHAEATRGRFRQEMLQMGQPEETLDASLEEMAPRFVEEAANVLRRQVLLESLVIDFEAEAEDEEVQERFRDIAERTGMNIARIRSLYDNPERVDQLKGQIRSDKVLDRLLEMALENHAKADAIPEAKPEPATDEPAAEEAVSQEAGTETSDDVAEASEDEDK